eukprot:4533469-Pleurochrysis_carterae.AAC.4
MNNHMNCVGMNSSAALTVTTLLRHGGYLISTRCFYATDIHPPHTRYSLGIEAILTRRLLNTCPLPTCSLPAPSSLRVLEKPALEAYSMLNSEQRQQQWLEEEVKASREQKLAQKVMV